MKPIEPDDTSLRQVHTTGVFLEKPGRLQEALAKNAQWNERFKIDGSINKRVHSLENSLLKLRHIEEDLGDEIQKLRHVEEDLGVEIRKATGLSDDEDTVQLRLDKKPAEKLERWSDDPCEFEEYDEFADFEDETVPVNVVPLETNTKDDAKKPEGPFVVLIRHGRTPYNNMQLFTGWADPPLAEEGVEDAKNAGRVLKRHGFEFDVVYTSWLTRAIQTAYYALAELDCVWLPIIKSWRLNERMYGNLTGKSKKMIANEYGEDQLKKWRRGYTIRPPPTSSYSLSYPGNDERRAKHFKDIRISVRETINRSLEQRKLSIHRKFPKSESLKDCMDRSIPFYTERIQREAVEKGKRVLITSHENAIRGILMHLCDIPEEAMNQLHLPNGLPLVYDIKGRCISLLDDGSGKDPMDAHDFGPAAKYLFKPCELDDAFFEEMEAQNSDLSL
jgi:2,3-bisphosphoglycerate-dependent phosphoglycerate mutase